MSNNTSAPAANRLDLAAFTQLRPTEIKTYHKTTYDRISPSKTFNGKNKTVLITGGGPFLYPKRLLASIDHI
jgi:hypothetical protein